MSQHVCPSARERSTAWHVSGSGLLRVKQVLDQPVLAVDRLEDPLDVLPGWRPSGEVGLEQLDQAADGGQRRPDLVGDARRHAAEEARAGRPVGSRPGCAASRRRRGRGAPPRSSPVATRDAAPSSPSTNSRPVAVIACTSLMCTERSSVPRRRRAARASASLPRHIGKTPRRGQERDAAERLEGQAEQDLRGGVEREQLVVRPHEQHALGAAGLRMSLSRTNGRRRA